LVGDKLGRRFWVNGFFCLFGKMELDENGFKKWIKKSVWAKCEVYGAETTVQDYNYHSISKLRILQLYNNPSKSIINYYKILKSDLFQIKYLFFPMQFFFQNSAVLQRLGLPLHEFYHLATISAPITICFLPRYQHNSPFYPEKIYSPPTICPSSNGFGPNTTKSQY